MLRNLYKIGFRSIYRNPSYTIINVLGLSLGISCAILIFSLVRTHLSYDNFHSNSERIFRIVTEQHRDVLDHTPGVPAPLGKALRNDFTYTEMVARVITFDHQLVSVQRGETTTKFLEPEGFSLAEPEFLKIFNFPLVKGDSKTVLNGANAAVITQRLANKYFGDEDPLNKIIQLGGKTEFLITGILKDIPPNTDIRAEIYVSYSNLKDYNEWLASDDSWGGIQSATRCYVLLRPSVTPKQVEDAMAPYVKKFRPTSKNVHVYKLQPLNEIHFDARYSGVMEKRNLWVLSLIGLFLVVTACVNFVNLATAQALNRAREVGVRKVLGSQRGQLFWQFIIETGFITLMAVVLSGALVSSLLPVINQWFSSDIQINLFSDKILWGFMGTLLTTVVFLAGSYPGLIMAGFKPVVALKGKLSQMSIGGFNTRRTLIVAQFAISQVLIIGMLVITSQMNFSKKSDLGFDKDAVVMIPIATGSNLSTIKTMKSQFAAIPGVEDVTLCSSTPSSSNNWTTAVTFDNRTEAEDFRMNVKAGDDDYLKAFRIPLVAGVNVTPSDSVRGFLVNEKFVAKLNLATADDVLGRNISINGDVTAPIVGVMKDFHDRSFHEDINPVCISTWSSLYELYAVKIDKEHIVATLASLDKTWSERHPDQIYESQFLDSHIAEFYQTEDRMLKFIEAFSLVAILIGCLGLYGLVSFMAAQKTKEIGIRKVLGGSMLHVLWLFGKEFSTLIAIAFIISGPIGWWVMNGWLQDFKYKINIGAVTFILAIGITFIIAAITVGYQSIKAALTNPARSLRSE